MYRAPTQVSAEQRFADIIMLLDTCDSNHYLSVLRKTLKQWQQPILNYFLNRTTNGFTEGCHTKIKMIKRVSYGLGISTTILLNHLSLFTTYLDTKLSHYLTRSPLNFNPAFRSESNTKRYNNLLDITLIFMQILTFYEREKIEYYRRLKLGVRDISRRLVRDPSIISRELKRNLDRNGKYNATVAQRKADFKSHKTNKRRLATNWQLHDFVENRLN